MRREEEEEQIREQKADGGKSSEEAEIVKEREKTKNKKEVKATEPGAEWEERRFPRALLKEGISAITQENLAPLHHTWCANY